MGRDHGTDATRTPHGGTALVVITGLLFGGLIGLASTALMLTGQVDPAARASGPWVFWPKAGTPAIDPYARALLARSGAVALAAAEGLAFTAERDETGAALSARCTYRVAAGEMPARVWTLTATTVDGWPMETPAGRGGFSSNELLRAEDGRAVILAGPSARPGNWLPLSGRAPFRLTLRLYDTPLSAAPGDIAKTALPTLTPLGCAP